MTNRFEIRVLLTAILFLVPITGGLTTMLIIQEREETAMSTNNDGWVSPKYLGFLIKEVQSSLVTIGCKDAFGSGFSFYLDDTDTRDGFKYRETITEQAESVLITNHHVIANCIPEGIVEITIDDETTHQAKIVNTDIQNDLALLVSDVEISPISGAAWKPSPGFWTMALGSPHNFAGSVTLGNIINQDSGQVFHTASLSPGNSGGPLVDNDGYLYGVNTGSKPVGQNFNLSVGVNAFCEKLINCTKSAYWADK
jgi:S1-C subfamily serine protease